MLRPALAAALLCLTAGAVSAQDSTARSPLLRSCFRGRPLPDCRSFWITEATYAIRPRSGGFTNPDDRYSLSLDLGRMWNLDARWAVGAGVSGNLVNGLSLAVRPRIRYWIGRTTSIDLVPGLPIAGSSGRPRFVGDLSLMVDDVIGVTGQMYLMPSTTFRPGGSSTSHDRLMLFAGLKLGSELGVYGAAADALVFLIVVGTYLIACGGNCD